MLPGSGGCVLVDGIGLKTKVSYQIRTKLTISKWVQMGAVFDWVLSI